LCSHWFGVIIFINNTTVATTNSIQFNSINHPIEQLIVIHRVFSFFRFVLFPFGAEID